MDEAATKEPRGCPEPSARYERQERIGTPLLIQVRTDDSPWETLTLRHNGLAINSVTSAAPACCGAPPALTTSCN
ncbi:MAG: hypothetical protein WAO35_06475 [Terriglobia bacterium]